MIRDQEQQQQIQMQQQQMMMEQAGQFAKSPLADPDKNPGVLPMMQQAMSSPQAQQMAQQAAPAPQ